MTVFANEVNGAGSLLLGPSAAQPHWGAEGVSFSGNARYEPLLRMLPPAPPASKAEVRRNAIILYVTLLLHFAARWLIQSHSYHSVDFIRSGGDWR